MLQTLITSISRKQKIFKIDLQTFISDISCRYPILIFNLFQRIKLVLIDRQQILIYSKETSLRGLNLAINVAIIYVLFDLPTYMEIFDLDIEALQFQNEEELHAITYFLN